MTDYVNAGELFRLIVNRIDGVGGRDWLGESIYVYGGGPNDAVLVGLENTTTVLVVCHDGPRWFQLDLREFDPFREPIVAMDYDVLQALARRAGITPPGL